MAFDCLNIGKEMRKFKLAGDRFKPLVTCGKQLLIHWFSFLSNNNI